MQKMGSKGGIVKEEVSGVRLIYADDVVATLLTGIWVIIRDTTTDKRTIYQLSHHGQIWSADKTWSKNYDFKLAFGDIDKFFLWLKATKNIEASASTEHPKAIGEFDPVGELFSKGKHEILGTDAEIRNLHTTLKGAILRKKVLITWFLKTVKSNVKDTSRLNEIDPMLMSVIKKGVDDISDVAKVV
jgi:hypothetical protein